MYNVKVIKYVSGGYQVRVYNQPVGLGYVREPDLTDTDFLADLTWIRDSEIGDYVLESNMYGIPCEELVLNPFSEKPQAIKETSDAMQERSRKVSMARTVNRVYYLTRSNVWDWFVTLTFNPDKVDSFSYEECVKRLSKWLNNCRRASPKLKYLVVPELHKSGRYHYHGLFAHCDGLRFVDSGHKAGGQSIYNIGSYKLGFTTATKVSSTEKVSKYVTKYITKELCGVTFGRKRYWASRNLDEAETQEYILEPKEKELFLKEISPYIQHARKIEGDMIQTTYLELSEGVEISMVPCSDS